MTSALVLLLAAVVGQAAAPPTIGAGSIDAPAVFERANQAFEEGVAALEDEPQRAERLLRQAAAGYRRLIEEAGIANARLHVNLANAHLLLDDVGRAILHYRRAERLDPNTPNLRTNLAEAKQRVRRNIDIESKPPLVEIVLGWRRALTERVRFQATLGAWAAAWLWLALAPLGVWRRRARWPALALALAAIVGGATLGADAWARASWSHGVVVAEETVGRKGPNGAAYEPSFNRPLPAGVEFRAVERRDDWLLARLADGRETWLSTDDVALVAFGSRD